MKNKTLLFLFLIFTFIPTWILFIPSPVVAGTPKDFSSQLTLTIALQIFWFLPVFAFYSTLLDIMTFFNRRRKIKELFGEKIKISRYRIQDFYSYPYVTVIGAYEITYKEQILVIHFEEPSNYSFKEILDGKSDVLEVEDITKKKEAYCKEVEEENKQITLQKEAAHHKIKEITNKRTISS